MHPFLDASFAAFSAKRTLVRQSWKWQRIFLYLLIIAYTILARLGYTGLLLWTDSFVLDDVALVFVILGTGIEIWARTSLGRNWSADLTLKERHELVRSGPYRFVRHPIYTGFSCLTFGTILWYRHLEGFLLFFALLIGLYLRARKEETLLATIFPESYAAYKKKVRMFIPYIL
ncbi:MAG: isoprenylcysteine carboxylmethyltransferase family protein [Candidatus Peribacteraceae bacterium]|nr:isoprenylcysteine carboxylmethyltransferase family protein [Candidatus Peribacteraceae bacterium]